MTMLEQIPMLGGAVALFTEGDDVRRNISYALLGIMAILWVLETVGFTIGSSASQVVQYFPIFLAYWFGQKEAEQK